MAKSTKCSENGFYILNMFPYPSGEGLHVGHPLGYVASDIYARYKKMQGYKVINPMGFDSFGLPAEQYAILTGQHPAITTAKNINNFIRQLKNIDLDFDWDRMVTTSDPRYYKWTQWIFIQMFNSFYCKLDNKAHNIEDLYKYFEKNGTKNIDNYVSSQDLKYEFTADQWNSFSEDKKYKISLDYRIAYLDDIEVNWCEGLKTVLANDEVKNGVSERGGFPVVKKKMKQWVLRITAYADRLLDDLDCYYQKVDNKVNNYVKCFKKNDLKPNLKIEERNIILAIIKHWGEDKYLVIRYKKNNSRAFVTGGIESNETPEEALIREIKEETGFINIRKIEKICNTDCTFYNSIKNVNRRAFTCNYYVELENGENIEVSKEEQNISDFEWVNEDELENIISYEEEYYPFKIFKEHFKKIKLDWPESTKEMQRNWIGKSEGANIKFEVFKDDKFKEDYEIIIFTSRPETIFGVTFLGLSKDHEFVKRYCDNLDLSDIKDDSETKVGINTGYYVINPFNNEKVPIWIANYILGDYGTGAIMGVPHLDDRDKDFAEKYGIDIKNIFEDAHFINSEFLSGLNIEDAKNTVLNKIKELNLGCGETTYKLRDAIFSRQRYWGEPIPIYYKEVNVDGSVEKLPFTIVEQDLPLKLPDIYDYKPTGEAPLKRAKNWNYKGYELETNTMPGWAGSSWYFLRYLDPNNDKEFCSEEKLAEFENVDLYLGGSEHAVGHLLYSRFFTKFLYDLGYINFEEPFKKLIHQGMILGESALIYRINGTNKYITCEDNDSKTTEYKDGTKLICEESIKKEYIDLVEKNGITTIHIPIKFVDDEDYPENDHNDITAKLEELRKWRPDFNDAEFLKGEGTLTDEKKGVAYRYPFFKVKRVIEKMSKSKYNVINPDDVISKYGSDVFRMYLMFLGPIEQQKPWNTKGIEGIARFLNKLNNITKKVSEKAHGDKELKSINRCIKDVGTSLENFSFNTAISSLMICLNELSGIDTISKDTFKKYLLLIKPFAPKTAKKLWREMFKNKFCASIFTKKFLLNLFTKGFSQNDDIDVMPFPVANEEFLKENTVQYPVMINGKVRAQIVVNKNITDEQLKDIVLKNDVVVKWVNGVEIKNFIIVKEKIVSIVTESS